MTSRPKALLAMLRHAEHLEQQAQQRWAAAQGEYAALERQRHELQQYAAEYQQAGRQAASAGALNNHVRFCGRLQLAVDQQSQRLAQARHRVQALQGEWMQRRQRLAALQELQAQRVSEWQLDQLRAEQKALDEFAMRALPR